MRISGQVGAGNNEGMQRHPEHFTSGYAGIQQLPASVRQRFDALMQASGRAAEHDWELPQQIVEKKEGKPWKHHLYANAEGNFTTKLNGWETELLEAAMAKDDFIAWFRNVPRRDWALCVPYEFGGKKPFFPDFIVIRKGAKGLLVDVLEPHDDGRTDTWAKARGLAEFADNHGILFDRLIIARKKGNLWQLANINDKGTRDKARKMQSSSDLESLFA
jgi:type III restriction enzyme